MSLENAISYGIFDGFTWLRCEGKGSFMQSPALKECAEQRLASGERHFVVDLEACTGMDSTFMGFLAGLAARVGKLEGWVQIATPGERNRRSLEDLGLDCLLQISPPEAPWRGRVEEIRGGLDPFELDRGPDARERARHVLDAHRTLAGTSEENAAKFSNVLQVLEKEVPKEDEDRD